MHHNNEPTAITGFTTAYYGKLIDLLTIRAYSAGFTYGGNGKPNNYKRKKGGKK
jgi:hypothetical protein